MTTAHEISAGSRRHDADGATAATPGDGGRPLDRQFIAGKWRDGRAGRTSSDLDPFTGETLAEISLADRRDVDDAYQAARSAQREWAGRLPMERAAVMSRAAAVMEDRRDEIIGWLIREAGGLLLASIFEDAELPPGVLNVVVGAGRDIGDAFVTHPIPRVISFTGSTPVGRGIVRQTADSPVLKRVELELGGNSPLVVLDDADLELALNAAVFGRFLHQGQICMSTNRIIVDDAVHDDFVERFAERVRGLKVGDPTEPDTVVGPVINRNQLDGHRRRIADARSAGARELVGGEPDGLVLPPHVFADVGEDLEIVREETFGPIAPVVRARDEEDALRLANGTEYGLSSAVFTRDEERGVRFARRIEAGMTHVNDQTVNDLPNNPFGGEKNSGFGRFGGECATMAFTTDHWVTVQHEPRPYPFDARADEAHRPVGGG
jgi:aldehyde dehydrogenase (NAD+)